MTKTALIAWLQERNDAIKKLEAAANAALYGKKDESAYRGLMRQKTELIAALEKDAAPLLQAIQEPTATTAQERLAGFSAGARNALSLNSVFYMSALLYPDEHKDGEPNNLERLITELQN